MITIKGRLREHITKNNYQEVDHELVELKYQIECDCFEHFANQFTKQEALELLLKKHNHVQSKPKYKITSNVSIYDDILKIVNNIYDMEDLILDDGIEYEED